MCTSVYVVVFVPLSTEYGPWVMFMCVVGYCVKCLTLQLESPDAEVEDDLDAPLISQLVHAKSAARGSAPWTNAYGGPLMPGEPIMF